MNLIGNFYEGLALVNYSRHFLGFINKSGELVIETPFVEARNFSEDLAVAKIQEKGFYGQSKTSWGAIDKNGRIIFEGDFDKLSDFSEGVAIAEKNDEIFFVNKLGEKIFAFDKSEYGFDYNGTKNFSEGLTAIFDYKIGKFGFMNKNGELVIKPKFENAANFSDGLARVSIKKDHREYLGFINTEGDYVIEPKFDIDGDFLRSSNDFSEDMASLIDAPLQMDKEQSFLFIDKKGNIVWKTDFFRAETFHEGLCMVCSQEGFYGYIDKSGKTAIPIKYYLASNFSEGLALVA
ncbi:MAG TPA: WG repeat-containing protein [Pyrinomonadaceae bacterium]|nr:WG repeat-containing protein [Pyrinomonadaceae bacterium]